MIILQGNLIFNNIEDEDVNKMLTCFQAKKIKYKKERTIMNNIGKSDTIGIILNGTAELVRYDYNGNRTIIEVLRTNNIFGNLFTRDSDFELSVVATSECEILFINYESILKRCNKSCPYHNTFLNNVIQILAEKIVKANERIEIITKRTTREKLLGYFSLLSKRNGSKTITIPFSYTDLADYLSIDRSAMMRELKYLKEEKIIETNGRKVIINTR